MNRVPLVSSYTRVWAIEGGARFDREPEFLYYMKMDTVEKNFGSVNPIYEPSKFQYNEFDETGSYRDEEERPTTSLIGRYPQSVKSRILELANRKCDIDVQLHIGSCTSPGVFNDFEKIVVFENVAIQTYSTDALGAIEPGDRSPINETVEVSAKKMFEFVPIQYAARTPSVVTNEILASARCDDPTCGACGSLSDGCQKLLAVTSAAGGSPGTPADLLYSLDGGATYDADDIDTLGIANDPSDVACVAGYVVVVSATNDDEMHIVDADDIDGVTDPVFTQIDAGFVNGGSPQCIDSLGNIAYMAGNGGYIYKTSDPPSGVTVVDAGQATISVLNDIDMLTEEFVVAVGNDGAVVVIRNDVAAAIANRPVGLGVDLTCVYVESEDVWMVGATNGNIYATEDGGLTWTTIALTPTPSLITDIKSPTKTVIYVAAKVDGKGEIFISVDAGSSFILSPRSAANAMPANDGINTLTVCPYDIDFVAGYGLAADGVDGFVVIGTD